MLPEIEMKILNAAKEEKEIYVRLKELTRLQGAGTFSPFIILEVIRKNKKELIKLLDELAGYIFMSRLTLSDQRSCNIVQDQQNLNSDKKLDTDYKYPIKVSKSIWTVKNK